MILYQASNLSVAGSGSTLCSDLPGPRNSGASNGAVNALLALEEMRLQGVTVELRISYLLRRQISNHFALLAL